MDLAINNLQMLIFHKTQINKQTIINNMQGQSFTASIQVTLAAQLLIKLQHKNCTNTRSIIK